MVALPPTPAGVQVEPLTFEVQDGAGANVPVMEQTVLRLAVQVTLVLAAAVNAAVWQSRALEPPVQAYEPGEPVRVGVQVGAAGVT